MCEQEVMAGRKRTRTERRQSERETKKLADAREKLALVSEGGSPERPLVVESASIVEARASALGCARCGNETRIAEHDAVKGLRRIRAICKRCGAMRETWLVIAERLIN
jgi:hypothetical protein